jgi:hypothetical protein
MYEAKRRKKNRKIKKTKKEMRRSKRTGIDVFQVGILLVD